MEHVSRITYQKGFTLIEALVATSLFAFVVSSILGVYVSTLRLDSKTRSQRAVSQNTRFIMEFLSKEIRNGYINYGAYPGQRTFTTDTDFWIVNQAGENVHVYLNGTDLKLEKDIVGVTNLNTNKVRVTRFKALAAPDSNPYTTTWPPPFNQQPNITILLELTSNFGSRPDDLAAISVQTTLTPRFYPSRRP